VWLKYRQSEIFTMNTRYLLCAGKYGKYCDVRQSAVTVIWRRDVTLKSCLEWLTRSYIHWTLVIMLIVIALIRF